MLDMIQCEVVRSEVGTVRTCIVNAVVRTGKCTDMGQSTVMKQLKVRTS